MALPEAVSHAVSAGPPPQAPRFAATSLRTAVFTGNDVMTLALKNGDLQGKPFQVIFHAGEPVLGSDDPGAAFRVLNTEPTSFTSYQTLFKSSWQSISLTQQAMYGTVQLNADGSFTYTPQPDPVTGEPYFGWDFFSYTITEDYLPPREAWVQLYVGDYVPPTITVAPLLIEATMGEIEPTVEALESGYVTAKEMLGSMLLQLSQLGQGVGQVGDAGDLQIIDKLDAATANVDSIANQYDQYISQLVKLNKAAGTFLARRWFVSQRDSDAVANVNRLPFKVGSLSASKKQMDKLAESLASLGEGAGVAVDTANKIVRAAEVTHKVLTTVEMAGGVTMLVKTGATLLVKEGLKACAKTAAKELMQQVGSAVAAEMANWVADLVGIPPEWRQYIAIGVDAYQAFAFLKAARMKVDPNGNCFAAGTNVIVGVNEDGTLVTKPIEQIEENDYVLSRDQYDKDDDLDARQVTQLFRKTSDHLRILRIQGDDGNIETIRTTDTHPFYVQTKGWIGAGELSIGDLVQETDGTWQSVLATSRESHPEGITVYNLEVDGDHTYFVEDGFGAADAVWVHNLCVGGKFVVGNFKGKPLPIDVPATSKVFNVRTPQETSTLRTAFEATDGPRQQFLRTMANNPQIQARLSPADIQRMRNGLSPTGFEVHHKHPLQMGGDNSQSNLMLLQNDKGGVNYHGAVTVEQNRLMRNLPDGETAFEANWPDFPGVIYP